MSDTKTPKCPICGKYMVQHPEGGFYHCAVCDAAGLTGIAKRGNWVVNRKGLPTGGD